jgi:predicted flap endonuclease-1-like 5' DNA nuclease
MKYKIEEIEGIGPGIGAKLKAVGIVDTDKLLERCGAKKGRSEVAKETGLDESRLLKWANMADLMRISGVGEEFSELLEAAGVDTVKELQHRNAATLAAKMAEVNETKKLTRTVPAASQVTKWIEEAKTLKPMISH